MLSLACKGKFLRRTHDLFQPLDVFLEALFVLELVDKHEKTFATAIFPETIEEFSWLKRVEIVSDCLDILHIFRLLAQFGVVKGHEDLILELEKGVYPRDPCEDVQVFERRIVLLLEVFFVAEECAWVLAQTS